MRDLAVVLALLFGIVMFGQYWTATHATVKPPPDAYERARARYQAAHSGSRRVHSNPTPVLPQKEPEEH
jgi:hypothetical protein